MVRSRKRKAVQAKVSRDVRRRGEGQQKQDQSELTPEQIQKQQKRFDLVVAALILIFGIFISGWYFGHQEVPNPDFVAFVDTAHAFIDYMYSFIDGEPGTKPIQNFKRVPGLGLLQVGLSYFMPGMLKELTAGWVLNGIFYSLTGILLYVIGKRFIGRAAVWLVLLVLINPLGIMLLRSPIAEIPLRFFMLLSFYLILRRSRWRYPVAAFTSMIRYDGTALILAAFVMDLIKARTWRERAKPALWSALALLPLVFWLRGMYLDHLKDASTNPDPAAQSIRQIEYINHYNFSSRVALLKFSNLLWRESIGVLGGTVSEGSDASAVVFNSWGGPLASSFDDPKTPAAGDVTKILMILCLMMGVGYGLHKKQWMVLILLIFTVPYYFIHSLRYNTNDRHTLALTWVVVLLSLYGLQSFRHVIKGTNGVSRRFLLIYLPFNVLFLGMIWYMTDFISLSRWWLAPVAVGYGGLIFWRLKKPEIQIPHSVVIILQVVLILVAGGWFLSLMPHISTYSNRLSPQSSSVPYVAWAAAAGIFVVFIYFFRRKNLLSRVTILSLMMLIIAGNQFVLARYVLTGSNDKEFKMLAMWYLENAQPQEKLITTMPHVVDLFAPEHSDYFIKTSRVNGTTWEQFVEVCVQHNVSYVAWDSRIGLQPRNAYYQRWRVGRIARLGDPRMDTRPFEFIHQIQNDTFPRLYINLYRFHPEWVDKSP